MVYILSPYITSETAEEVLENVENCELYTLFNIENFINGSSSIETLKNLIYQGFNVYFIPQLHAKIVLVVDKFVSIGSQNLTNQGTRNKEATFTSTSLSVVKFIEDELQKWFVERTEVSLELLEDIKDRISHLQELYDEFRDEVEKVEEQIELEKSKGNNIQENLKRLIANLAKIEKTQEYVKGTVRNYSVWTFMPDSSYGSDLLNWQIGSEFFELKKTNRYLTLIENTGKLGWARVMKTRISYYEESIAWSGYTFLSKEQYKVTFYANWEQETLSRYNLEIRLDNAFFPARYGKIFAWFDSQKIEIIEIQVKWLKGFEEWMQENINVFKNIILEKLLTPFKYNKNLTGVEANKFLDADKYELRLGKIKDQPILLFSEI